MNKQFLNVKIDELTDAECRELLHKIDDLVNDFPTLTIYAEGRIYDDYTCCAGNQGSGHAAHCPVGEIKQIFGC